MKTTDKQFLEASNILSAKYSDFKVISSVDYQEWFVFNIQPKKVSDKGLYFMPLIGVNKQNGSIIGFNPLQHDPARYFEASKNKINIGGDANGLN